MGYELMLNFNHPYLATSLSDFWSRWHISLSTWFRDYVYIPLGGNRKGKRLGGLFLMLTFLTSAVWHGAAWTFVIWGALHALGTFVNRWLSHADWYQECLPLFIKRLLVFGFVCLAWVFFRASSVADAWLILSRMVSGPWSDPAMPLLMMGLVAGVWLYQWVQESPLAIVDSNPCCSRSPPPLPCCCGFVSSVPQEVTLFIFNSNRSS